MMRSAFLLAVLSVGILPAYALDKEKVDKACMWESRPGYLKSSDYYKPDASQSFWHLRADGTWKAEKVETEDDKKTKTVLIEEKKRLRDSIALLEGIAQAKIQPFGIGQYTKPSNALKYVIIQLG